MKTEARSTQISKTKHPNLENEAPKTRKRRPLNLENEAPKTRNHCRFNKCNFTSYMTQSESGGGSGCVRTSKGPQNPFQGFIIACQLFNWTFLERISCINIIISLAIFDTSYLNMHFFGTHTCLCRLQNCPSADFGVFTYAWAVTQKVWNEAEDRVWVSRVLLLRHALPRFQVCGCFVFDLGAFVFEFVGASF